MSVIVLIIFAILMLPGLAYILVIAFIYGFVDHFDHLTWQNLLVLGLILVYPMMPDSVFIYLLSFFVDNISLDVLEFYCLT